MTGQQDTFFSKSDPIRYGSVRRRRRLILPRFLDREAIDTRLKGPAQTEARRILLKWADLDTSGKLQQKSETSLHGEFLGDIFVKALGYTPFADNQPHWNLWPEFPLNGGQADAAIGVFTSANGAVPRALVELKGPTVNLDRDRSGGRTPVQQLWDYLNMVPDCPWGILSNYVSIRLYHRAKTPYVFELFTLQDLRDEKAFRQFYALLERGALLPSALGQRPRLEQLLDDSENRQREVGDELYEKYSDNRLAMIHHLHTEREKSLDAAIRIAQLLLDRIMFVAFCEDRDLLPDDSLRRAYDERSPFTKVTNPRWQNFINLFRAVDVGHADIGLKHGYNGNLFKPHEADELQLDDEWTDFFKEIGRYDFRDEVNVEVLGHLFEKSVNEIERIRAGGLFGYEPKKIRRGEMPKSAERKRFGVYYTPPEFTEFLIEKTVGVCLKERYSEIAQRHGLESAELDQDAPKETFLAFGRECLAALRNLKVVDPACGSGAFVVRAFEFLEERYRELLDRLVAHGDHDAHDLIPAIPNMILADNLFGVDVSEEAVEITQLSLWIRSARPNQTLADLSKNIVCGNSLVDDPTVDPKALDWRKTFPGVFDRDAAGFDVVIGNPPWERLKLQEREFFSFSAPNIAAAVSAATRRTMISELAKKLPELHARYVDAKGRADRMLDYARTGGRFPLTGKGDINTYVLFAELARTLAAPSGRAGILVPSGIATDDTTKEFFAESVSSRSLISLHDFENKRPWFPDVHRSFKFCTLVFGGSKIQTPKSDFAFFLREVEDLEEKKRHIPLDADDLALVNPNTRTCPIFRGRRDAKLTKSIYKRVPILIDHNRKKGGNPWGIKFFTMFHQTNDAELFHTREQLRELGFKQHGSVWRKRNKLFLPLYEAKMVQSYDHRAAGVVVEESNWMRQGQTKPTSLVSHQNPEFTVEPRWWVTEGSVLASLESRRDRGFIGFKDITSPTNERTMIAAAIPWSAVTNHFPLLLTGAGPRLELCLLANLNSFALDYTARQKIGAITLNFFIVEQFPIFPPDKYAERCPWNRRQTLEKWISDRVLKLTCTADDMRPLAKAAGFSEAVHPWKPDERATLLAELDAAYFQLYGVSRDDAEYILSTFTGTQRRDETDVGTFRTSGLILEAFDRFRAESGGSSDPS